jgi:hypothetical protein
MPTLLAYAITGADLVEVKRWLNLSVADTGPDDVLTEIVNAVTELIENEVNRRVVVRTDAEAEVFSGDGSPYYRVLHPPISTLTAMTIAIENHTSPTVSNTDQVRIDMATGEIWLLQDVFAAAYPRNCTVTYKGGWALGSVPRPIWQVTRAEIARMYRERDRKSAEVQSVSAEGQTVTYFKEIGLTQDSRDKLARYKVWR